MDIDSIPIKAVISLHSVGGSMGEAVNPQFAVMVSHTPDELNSIVDYINSQIDEKLWYVVWYPIDRPAPGMTDMKDFVQMFIDKAE